MSLVAILALHVTIVLVLHPLFPLIEQQWYLGGGAIGTPLSPTHQLHYRSLDRYTALRRIFRWLLGRHHPGTGRLGPRTRHDHRQPGR